MEAGNNAINQFLVAHQKKSDRESPRKITTVNKLGYLEFESILL